MNRQIGPLTQAELHMEEGDLCYVIDKKTRGANGDTLLRAWWEKWTVYVAEVGAFVNVFMHITARTAHYCAWYDRGESAKVPVCEEKYGTVTASVGTFHPMEPLFIFRATDPLTPLALRDYAKRCEEADCAPAYVLSVEVRADKVAAWQHANPALVKDKPD